MNKHLFNYGKKKNNVMNKSKRTLETTGNLDIETFNALNPIFSPLAAAHFLVKSLREYGFGSR